MEEGLKLIINSRLLNQTLATNLYILIVLLLSLMLVFRLQDFSGGSQGDVDLSSRDCLAHHRFRRAGIILRVHLLICPQNSHALLTVALCVVQRRGRVEAIMPHSQSVSVCILFLIFLPPYVIVLNFSFPLRCIQNQPLYPPKESSL